MDCSVLSLLGQAAVVLVSGWSGYYLGEKSRRGAEARESLKQIMRERLTAYAKLQALASDRLPAKEAGDLVFERTLPDLQRRFGQIRGIAFDCAHVVDLDVLEAVNCLDYHIGLAEMMTQHDGGDADPANEHNAFTAFDTLGAVIQERAAQARTEWVEWLEALRADARWPGRRRAGTGKDS